MFRRVLIPTDFSTASEWAFDAALRIAAASQAELVILHVRMTKPRSPGSLRFPFDDSLYDYAEQQELARLNQRAKETGLHVSTRLLVRRSPDPAGEICRTAADEKVDLIVMATHASHHVAHLLIGSTTHALLHRSPAPVLVIRYGTRKRERLGRVVVPIRSESGPSLHLATRVAGQIEAVAFGSDADRAAAESVLHATAPDAKIRLLPGTDRGKEIVRFATEVDADAIFLDASASPDETELDIIRHAAMPVMVVPADAS